MLFGGDETSAAIAHLEGAIRSSDVPPPPNGQSLRTLTERERARPYRPQNTWD